MCPFAGSISLANHLKAMFFQRKANKTNSGEKLCHARALKMLYTTVHPVPS